MLSKGTRLPALLMLITLAGAISAQAKKDESHKGWDIVWSDEFGGSSLDLTKWSYQLGTGAEYGLDGWGNNEQEYYAVNNVTLKNGCLCITAKKENQAGKPYTSGRIRTLGADGKPLFAAQFGRVEARIKLPVGDGLWPAFWMLPAGSQYGTWAASGEIDIMEAIGRLKNRVYGTLHYGQAWPGNKRSGAMYKFKDDSDIADFHQYAVEWEPGSIRWYVDGELFYQTSSWWGMGPDASEPYPYPAPFDAPFYIILNLAVGGTFDDNRVPADYEVPATMEVDYVRAYEKSGGYDLHVKRPEPDRDKAAFAGFAADARGNFIADTGFAAVNAEALTVNTMDVNSRNWYFLTLTEFGGKAKSENDGDFRHVSIQAPGGEVHSIQLLQHLGVARGYTYEISFDAKASAPRTIAVKLGGDADNSWAVYSSQYSPKLTTQLQHFSYRFTMESPSDKTARLEFNLGKDAAEVWIGTVAVKALDF
jgi:beta-glucanase (GH16 family)